MAIMNCLVTDSDYNYRNMRYLHKTLSETVKGLGGKSELRTEGQRSVFALSLDENAMKYLKPALFDKLADIIAVNYKYAYFRKYIRTSGLNSLEFELLLAALIAADLEEDKRFALSRLSGCEKFALDGAFNFTMKPLKEKWCEIIGYIPSFFAPKQLKDFIAYIVKDKKGKRVFVDKGLVYDGHYNRLSRSLLTEESGEAVIVKEVILSGSGEVELHSKLPETDEFYLKEFFGDKIFFSKGYFV